MKKFLFIGLFFLLSLLTVDAYSQNQTITGSFTAKKKITGASYESTMIKDIEDSVIHCDTSNFYRKTITEHTIFYFENLPELKWITVFVYTTGNFEVTWSGVTWSNDIAPSQTQDVDKFDMYSFIKIGNVIIGAPPIQNLLY